MAIRTYNELQTAVVNWTNRSDLTARIPEFIQLAEDYLRKDGRARRLRVSDIVVSGATFTLPDSFDGVESLAHDGSTHYGELVKTSLGGLSATKGELGASGVPAAFAIVPGDNVYRFAPVPGQSYTLRHAYWETVPRLGGVVLQNWLLEGHSDVYLHATLLQAAPYLKNDVRIPVWEKALNDGLEALWRRQNKLAYSGDLNVPGSLIW